MKLLVDTDAFCKLGAAGLLEDAMRIFRVELKECGRLPALPHMLRRGSIPRLFGAKVCEGLIHQAQGMQVVQQPADTWLERLTPIEAIDPGDAQILAVAAETGAMVVSGDKRALRAVRDVEGFVQALEGRVAVLEAVLWALCERLGSKEVRHRVVQLAELDTMVQVCFAPSNPNPQKALLSYFRKFASDLEPLVLWDPCMGEAT